MKIIGLLVWVVMDCTMPIGSEEVPCFVLTVLTNGPGASVSLEDSSQRGVCFADILGFLLDLEGPSR